jgi:hypothetical protein
MSTRVALLPLLLSAGMASAQQVATVTVTPAHQSVRAGETAQFAVQLTDANGQSVKSAVTWLATPFDIAASDSTGRVETSRPGHVLVLALVGSKIGMAELDIAERPAARVTISGPDTILVGETAVLTARPVTSVGDLVMVDGLAWRSDAAQVAEVDGAGAIRGVGAGTATITVGGSGMSATHRVVVRPNLVRSIRVSGPATVRVGEVASFSGRASGANGAVLSAAPQVWGVQGSGATITARGQFVATAPGTYVVTASVGSVAGTSSIRVLPRAEQRSVEMVGSARFSKDIQAAELWLSGTAAYVSTIADRIYVFDVSNPAEPRLTDSIMTDARLINDVAVTADGKTGVFAREGASNRKNGLVTFDASDPLHPKVITEYTAALEGGVHSAFIDGHYVYATHDPTGSLRIIDIADPAHPAEVGRYELPREAVHGYDIEFLTMSPQRYLHDVFVKDGLAYLAYWKDGLVILDVGKGIKGGSPSHPVLVGHFQYNHADIYPPLYIAGTHAVFVSGKYAFLGDEVIPGTADIFAHDPFPTRGRLHVIDLSDLEHLREVAWYDGGEFGVHNLWVEEGLLYIGAYTGGLRVLDVSGELLGDLKAGGREIGSLYTGAPDGFRVNMPLAWSAIPSRGSIFVSDINTGLWVAKVTGSAVTP